ncbi:unnamed protein product, partial [marine sediment metagenome]
VTDVYGAGGTWALCPIEIFKAAAWHDFIDENDDHLVSFYCDGNTLRWANSMAPTNFHRLIGVRRW